METQVEYITAPEAAEELKYTVQHTRLLARQGKLPGIKIGRDWLILRETVAEYKTRRDAPSLFPPEKRGRPRKR